MKKYELTGLNISIEDVAQISRAKLGQVELSIAPASLEKM
jgi:hypothetical protein